MTAQGKIKDGDKVAAPTGLDLLRAPFPANQISKLPKPTKRQTDEVKADFKKGIRCKICGAWHHPQVVHLDYVGHAALTDRLLDCDPQWNWEPVATNEDGTPRTDENGGMWIRLTVCGVTRIAKAKRGHRKHIGAHRPKSTLPGSKASKWKRRLDGTTVRRDET